MNEEIRKEGSTFSWWKRVLIVVAIVPVIGIGFFFGPKGQRVVDGMKQAGWVEEDQELLPRLGRIEGSPGEAAGSNEEALEKRVGGSSVVAFTELKEREGKYEEVIVEVFKLRTDIECFYGLGDSLGSVPWSEGRTTATRKIHFLSGNPAETSGAMSIHRGLILKQRDLPESLARQLIRESQEEGRPSEQTRLTSPSGTVWVERTWDELVARSAVVVLGKVEIENGMRQTLAGEVFYLDPKRPYPVAIGKVMDLGKQKIEANTRYPEWTLIFIDKELGYQTNAMAIYDGRLSGHGGMPVELARERLLELVAKAAE
ncbi:MAG: hypothetical protein ACJA16_005603 [Akkermansiaceae bacterium]|jgi:hypothetical protein